MKRIFFLLFLATFTISCPAQTKAGDAIIPNTVSYQGEKLALNGVGIRKKFWMDMYAGALYLATESSDSDFIMAANEPMAIKIHILSRLITQNKMVDAVEEGFENSTNGDPTQFAEEIAQFKDFFSGEINKNDIFDIVYLPSTGIVVYKNDEELGSIEGLEFKKTLFGIWLSDKPVDKDLKEDMLGKS